MPSLVKQTTRQLFPIVLQRQQLADAQVRYLNTLGLARKVKELTLAEWLATSPPEAGCSSVRVPSSASAPSSPSEPKVDTETSPSHFEEPLRGSSMFPSFSPKE
jgi:hypothetical protein